MRRDGVSHLIACGATGSKLENKKDTLVSLEKIN
jgi:hypothetical protein